LSAFESPCSITSTNLNPIDSHKLPAIDEVSIIYSRPLKAKQD